MRGDERSEGRCEGREEDGVTCEGSEGAREEDGVVCEGSEGACEARGVRVNVWGGERSEEAYGQDVRQGRVRSEGRWPLPIA